MKASRLITPLAVGLIAALVVALPASRARDLGGVIGVLTLFATLVAIRAIMALGLNVQWGYTGVFNFGVMAFFMVGAYTAAVITKPPATSEFVQYVGGFGDKLDFLPILDSEQWLPFLFGLTGAAVFSGFLAFLLSIPTLRLREDYLAIATIGVAELLRQVVIVERGLVNSDRGLIGIPRPFFDLVSPAEYKFIFFAIAIFALILIYIAVERGIRSPWGRVLRALREDELTTAASGKNVFAFKMQGFVFGAVIIGIAGAIFGYQQSSVSPDAFTHFSATFLIWVMLIVGGSGNNKGAIVGAFIVWGFWEVASHLRAYFADWGWTFLAIRISYIREFAVGVLIVTVLLLRSQGLVPEERRVSIWVERQLKRLHPAVKPASVEPVRSPTESGSIET